MRASLDLEALHTAYIILGHLQGINASYLASLTDQHRRLHPSVLILLTTTNIMKFTSVFVALGLSAVSYAASTGLLAVKATYDQHYDDANASTNSVACSNLTPKFPTLGSFPSFPNIGGAEAVSGFGSPECGSCWKLTDPLTGVSIFVTAIDTAGDGFNLSLEALNTLTNNNATGPGSAPVNRVQVDASECGL